MNDSVYTGFVIGVIVTCTILSLIFLVFIPECKKTQCIVIHSGEPYQGRVVDQFKIEESK